MNDDQRMAFADWLHAEVDRRGWSMSELGRRAGVSHTSISMVMNGGRRVGPEVARGLASALNVAPVIVFRRGGLLPPVPAREDELEEIVRIVSGFSAAQRRELLVALRALQEWRDAQEE